MNKRAIVFTFITVIFLAIIIVLFLININNRTQTKMQTLNVKVETLNGFVKNMNIRYLPDALRASSNQAMTSMLDYESNESTYIEDELENYFIQVLGNGYYNNIKQEDMFQNNLNFTLTTTLNEIKKLADLQGVVFEYTQQDVENAFGTLRFEQKDPWHINVVLEFDYRIRDIKDEISWNLEDKEIKAVLDVQNYRDPLYLVEQDPGVSVRIKKAPDDIDFSNLQTFNDHMINVNFTNNTLSPSFLNRLRGDFTASDYGIESLLDPVYYENPLGYSNADYQYFSQISGLCVEGMPSSFKLDQDHLEFYSRNECLA